MLPVIPGRKASPKVTAGPSSPPVRRSQQEDSSTSCYMDATPSATQLFRKRESSIERTPQPSLYQQVQAPFDAKTASFPVGI